jgi:mycothiol synthase
LRATGDGRVSISESDARAVHATLEEAFADQWEPTPVSFDEWWRVQGIGFDPGLWFVAEDVENIVGALIGRATVGEASIDDLGVRAPWRRRGLGRLLLLASFAEFQRRGVRRVELNVDSESLTNATRLYERAGMRVVSEFDHFEKIVGAPVSRREDCSWLGPLPRRTGKLA